MKNENINLENSYCKYCRGLISSNEIDQNYHSNCHNEVKDLTDNPYYYLSDMAKKVLPIIESLYRKELPLLEHFQIISILHDKHPVGYSLHGDNINGIKFTIPLTIQKFILSIGWLSQLEYVNLKGARLRKFPVCLINQNKNLKKICLAKNNLHSIPMHLPDPEHLTELDLSYNYLKSFPFWVKTLTSLKKLNLRRNKISSLTRKFSSGFYSQLLSLEELILDRNLITDIPNSLEDLINLNKLSLTNNILKHLSISFDKLIKLEHLNLNHNHLENLPETLTGCSKLFYMDLSYNTLQSLPVTLGKLSRLEFLSASFNQLTALPDSILGLTNLDTLFINNNHLSELPDSFQYLQKLSFLRLHFNEFEKFPDVLTQISSLEIVSLTANNINSLPDEMIQLTLLRELDLSKNSFSEFPIILTKLKSIQKLDLSFNDLSVLPKLDNRFISFHQLTHLNLSRNNFKDSDSLPIEFFSKFPKLKSLYTDTPSLLPESLKKWKFLSIINTDEFYNTEGYFSHKLPITFLIIDLWIEKNQSNTPQNWNLQLEFKI